MSISTVRNAFITGLILAFATAALAQGNDNHSEVPRTPYYGLSSSGLISMLARPGVQQELRLDESESQKLLDSLRKIDPIDNSFPEVGQQRIATITARMDEVARRCEAAVQKSLSADQFRRLQQLDAQRKGGRALLQPQTAEQLALTAEQQETLKTIHAEFLSEGKASRAAIAAGTQRPDDAQESVRREKFDADLLAVLTPEQMKQWKAMTGAPFRASKPLLGQPWRLVLVPEVQTELGLSEDEAAALVQSLETIQNKVIEEAGRTNRPKRSEADAQRLFDEIIDTVRSSLAVSQWNRLQELILQDSGVKSFAHPEVAKKMGLSREQRDRVRETIGEYHLRGLIPARQQKEKTDVLDILTPDQLKLWEAMQGAKIDPSLLKPRFSPAEKRVLGKSVTEQVPRPDNP